MGDEHLISNYSFLWSAIFFFLLISAAGHWTKYVLFFMFLFCSFSLTFFVGFLYFLHAFWCHTCRNPSRIVALCKVAELCSSLEKIYESTIKFSLPWIRIVVISKDTGKICPSSYYPSSILLRGIKIPERFKKPPRFHSRLRQIANRKTSNRHT